MYSILRGLQYKEISKILFKGKILDIGGSKKSTYNSLMSGEYSTITANINSDYGCDLVFDVQKKFPIEDNHFDTVLALNLFEHVFSFHNAFSETGRVLKPGGSFIFSTPFLYQIHGSPDDFFRYTESALKRLLIDNNFEIVEIKSLGYGIFSLIFQIAGGVLPFGRNFFKNLSIILDKFLLKVSFKYRKVSSRIPLGYFVIARKLS